MSETIYVSNEEDLKASLTENHKLTAIRANYEPAIFKDYNIRYCFNEKTDPKCINFKSLKHVFDPDRSYDVIFGCGYNIMSDSIRFMMFLTPA